VEINESAGIIGVHDLAHPFENRPVKARPGKDIEQLRTEIHHIGNNINQLARKFNAGFGTKEDAKTVEYLMRQVYELMYQVAKE